MAKSKSLKDQNRWPLWFAVAANILAFSALINMDVVSSFDLKKLSSATAGLLPAGLTILLVTCLNGLFSSQMKARIVFMRWHHALPGHRAFTIHARTDPRINLTKLKRACGNKFPDDPVEQNSLWYRFLKAVEKDEPVAQVHRDFLMMRDYTALSALFAIIFSGAAFALLGPHRATWLYVGILAIQLIVVRQSAATYGVRLVQNVLARKAA